MLKKGYNHLQWTNKSLKGNILPALHVPETGVEKQPVKEPLNHPESSLNNNCFSGT